MEDNRSTLERLFSNPERLKQAGGKHYKGMVIQPMEYNYINNIPYIEGNIIKYVSTWRFREGLLDLEKALHYLEFVIADEKARLAANTGPGETFRPGTPEDGGHHDG